jgi:ELWxxDGT repeat protein
MKKIYLFIPLFFTALQFSFGQISLLADINPGSAPSLANEKGAMAQVGNTLFFSAENAQSGVELWKTDGTAAGTVLVKDINPGATGSFPDHFQVMGDRMFFTADDGVVGRELWITDGTPDGTILLADIRSGASSAFEDWFLTLDFSDFYVFQNQLFFRAYTGTDGLELYKSDGTPAGTGLLKSIGYASNDGCQGDFAEMNGELYFAGFSTSHGGQIWKTDGTVNGTIEVTTTLNDIPEDLTTLGNILIFVEDDGVNGPEIWKSDGTAAGTALLKNTDTDPGSGGLSHGIDTPEKRFFVAGTKAYFSVVNSQYDSQVWVTDGTPSGTKKLKSVGSSCVASHFAQLGNIVLFVSCDFEDKLWKTNGTISGTQTVQIFSGSLFSTFTSNFPLLHTHDGQVWFGGFDNDNSVLYKTDGFTVTPLPSGGFPGYFYSPQRFFSLGNNMIFWAKTSSFDDNLEPFIYRQPLNVTGSITAVTCNGSQDGAILVQPTGTAPFSAQWEPSTVTGLNPTGLAAGSYSVTVTDATGATGTATFQVTQPLPMLFSFSSTPQIGMTQLGTATANLSGGTPPYQYLWSTAPPQTTQTATDLLAGTVFCTATDANGCTLVGGTPIEFMVGTSNTSGADITIRLMPNPASEWVQVTIENGPNPISKYRIYNATGKLLRQFEKAPNDKLSLDGLTDGLYVLSIFIENTGWYHVRFLKAN